MMEEEEKPEIENLSTVDIDKQIKEYKIKEKLALAKIHFKEQEIGRLKKEISEISEKIEKLPQITNPPDIYLNPYLEEEFQVMHKIINEKEKTIEKTEIQNIFQIHQHQPKAKELVLNIQKENQNLGLLYSKEINQYIEDELRNNTERIIKLRKTLNDVNQQIKELEKEQKNQTDQISAQKRMINEEKKKKERFLEEMNDLKSK